MTAPLLPSETVLWRGRPDRYPVFDRSDLIAMPFGVLFACAFGYFFALPGLRSGSKFGIFLTVVFGSVLLYNLVGRLVVRQVTLRSSEYVVTDQRVVVRSKPFGRVREQAVHLTHVEPPVLAESADGTGAITFGDSVLSGAPRGSRPTPGKMIELEQIEDAQRVRDVIAAAHAVHRPQGGV